MRLIDCFTELLHYTCYLLNDIKNNQPTFEEVSNKYELLMKRSGDRSEKGNFLRNEWEQALYPVIAWIDETLLSSEWPDKHQWLHSKLQKQYFNTTNAGKDFFTRLKKLGKDSDSVREVYAFCLGLGFKGMYFHDNDEQKLSEIRLANMQHIIEDYSPDSSGKDLFPSAYGDDHPVKASELTFWQGPRLSLLVILVPILIFVSVYYFSDKYLSEMVVGYFGN